MLSIMIREFIQNQILGMKWMSTLIGNLLEKIGLDTSSRMGGSIQFFLYDVFEDNDIALYPDFYDFLYSKLLSTRTK